MPYMYYINGPLRSYTILVIVIDAEIGVSPANCADAEINTDNELPVNCRENTSAANKSTMKKLAQSWLGSNTATCVAALPTISMLLIVPITEAL